MAFCLPRRPNQGRMRSLGRVGGLGVLALWAMIVGVAVPGSEAKAQVIVGGNRGPAVTINDSVLDRLGPPLTLPQLFRGMRNPEPAARPTASTTHRSRTRHVATRRKRTHKTAVAEATRSSLHEIIHLIPPKPRIASAAPVDHETAAISEPTTTTVAALSAPTRAPAPQPPRNDDVPTPPVPPAQPAAVTPPSTPVTPPPQQQASAPPPPPANPAAMPSLAAKPASAVPFVPYSQAAMAATSPAPAAPPPAAPKPPTVAAAAPAIAAAPAASNAPPPVQMAAATTVGSGISVIKFAPGASDLPPGPQPALDAVAARLAADDNLRVQIIAHATGSADEAMEARRISLARAVAVRAYFIAKNISSLRIDVRALGNRADDGPAQDQVDLMVVRQ